MELGCLFRIVGVLLFTSTRTLAYDDIVLEMLKHIERLDTKIEAQQKIHATEIKDIKEEARLREAGLNQKIHELDQRVVSLEEENVYLRKHMKAHTNALTNLFQNNKKNHEEPNEKEDNVKEGVKTTGKVAVRAAEQVESDSARPRRGNVLHMGSGIQS